MTIILFLGALICLLLEMAGTPQGYRKLGTRPHIFLFSLLCLGATIGHTWPTSIVGLSAIASLIVAVPQMRHINKDRGDAYALLLVSTALMIEAITHTNIFYFVMCISLWILTQIALVTFRGSKQVTSEISGKLMLFALFWFAYMVLAMTLPNPLMLTFGVLIVMGLVPFHGFHASYVEGSPTFLGITFASGIFLASSIMLQHLMSPPISNIWWIFAAISLITPGILALDQQRIGRVCIHTLFILPGLNLITILVDKSLMLETSIHSTVTTIGILTGLMFWKHASSSDKTWEDFAGVGRKYPIIGMTWLASLASVAGIPGTFGFSIRLELIKRCWEQHWPLAVYLLVSSIIIAAVVIIRLGVFMFAKPTHFDFARHHQPRHNLLIIACGVVVMAGGLLFPQVLKMF